MIDSIGTWRSDFSLTHQQRPVLRFAGESTLYAELRPCHRCSRRGVSEFWLLLGVSLLAVTGLTLLLWAPWERRGIASDRTLILYCAAGMDRPVMEIKAEYEQRYGVRVQPDLAGSGELLSKIRTTRKGDLFLSADKFHIDKARAEGLVAETIPVAILRPVLIVNTETQKTLQSQDKPVTSLKDLLRPDLKVALANPELAAIGKTVKDALSDPKIALWPQLEQDLKSGSNRVSTVGTVNHVVARVRTSDKVIGIVWRSIAEQSADVTILPLPELDHWTELVQIGVLTTAHGGQATAALQFARFLSARDQGLVHFVNNHFEVIPDADIWDERPRLSLWAGAMLRPGVEQTVMAFAQREGVEIDTKYAGCGQLVSDMKAVHLGEKPGHFPDAYFACDVAFLDMVQKWFDAGIIVSTNDLVLVVPAGNPNHITKLQDLRDDRFKKGLKIGLADPTMTALGKITDELLRKLDLHDAIFTPDWRETNRVVLAPSGHELIAKMKAGFGSLDAAIVYRSNALSDPNNVPRHMELIDINIPDALAQQPFAIARDSSHKQLMRRLLQALVAQDSADRFKTLGFRWVYDGK
jgi:molybdenum ABC transporter molybdate-binding protein